MFREVSAVQPRREYSGEVVTSQDWASVEERGYSNGEVSRSIRLNFSQRFPSPMPVLCPTLPTGPLRMQTEQNVEDLCNSLRLNDYGPVLLRRPFWIWRSSFEHQRDFNPPEQQAAQHALWGRKTAPPSFRAPFGRPSGTPLPPI